MVPADSQTLTVLSSPPAETIIEHEVCAYAYNSENNTIALKIIGEKINLLIIT